MDNVLHILVNLPHILLSKITNHLKDNIDRICFTLVCSRWFSERDKYLSFNKDKILVDIIQKNDQFYLKSYQCLMSKSLESKDTCTLIIDNDQMTPGVLPSTLENLILGSKFNQPLEPGVLPASLRVLVFKGLAFKQNLQVGSLPPNLEVLEYTGFRGPITSEVLPSTLHTLVFIPISWAPAIQSHPNLKSLTFWEPYIDDIFENEILCLSDLPTSLTKLCINTHITLSSVLSPSIKYLELAVCKADGIFNEASKYQFETLKLALSVSLENISVKHLEIDNDSRTVEIPHDVETLGIILYSEPFTFHNAIPPSVKKLIVGSNLNGFVGFENYFSSDIITSSIEELRINYDQPLFSSGSGFRNLNPSWSFPIHCIPNSLVLNFY
ncbi:hypothetical protein PPL_04363 [Heterostelium album PN500]|uniref:F-box domain-containing protein n=1 Tax=Heterostelium pallidum (strain ATCC 26659 / Pp 5 / PN500) TaxID=670386 RepID=D3B7C6_HETP5|nr:hypothetical protein PPL_04363 [Heterostelium album PN500]EFA82669.1 hypothetical protein PPL_04363 [Heterostelium album PN500]|eukprot:XP_020434786.1 hypothetical protein PPL_04363 [Heterostelium album PN500]